MITVNYNNPNRYNPGFTSIRIVESKPEQYVKFVNEFKDFCSKNLIIRAESFHHAAFQNSLIKIGKEERTSTRWAFLNAQKYGLVDIEKIKQLPIIVMTGKDKAKYTRKTIKDFLFSLLPAYLTCNKSIFKGVSECPKHLIRSLVMKNFADKKLPQFKNFLEKNNAKKVSFNEFLDEVKSGKL